MKRIDFIDALKGLAIFFVLWGHSIQDLRNGSDFFHNPLYEFIYSFHMPLLFLISGFFFKSALKYNLREFLYKKSLQLLLPCLVWTLIFKGVELLSYTLIDHSKINWIPELKKTFLAEVGYLWFLKELFISYCLVYLAYKILKVEWLAFLMTICFVLIMPYLGMQRFLLPMFVSGILLKDHYQFVLRNLRWQLVLFGTSFAICMYFWDGNYTVYITKFPTIIKWSALSFDFSNLDISLFRFLIGLSGSLFWFLLFQLFYKENWLYTQLQTIGYNSLGIYILQSSLLEKIVNVIVNFPTINIDVYNLIITPIISVIVLLVCIALMKIIQRNKSISLLFFGTSLSK